MFKVSSFIHTIQVNKNLMH